MKTLTLLKFLIEAIDRHYYWEGNYEEGAAEQQERRARQAVALENALIYRLQEQEEELERLKWENAELAKTAQY